LVHSVDQILGMQPHDFDREKAGVLDQRVLARMGGSLCSRHKKFFESKQGAWPVPCLAAWLAWR
jgi:hypothetical protein